MAKAKGDEGSMERAKGGDGSMGPEETLVEADKSISPLPCVTWQQQRPHEDELPARRSSFARPSGVEKAPFAEVSDAGKTQQAPPPALDLEDNPLGADNADNRQASVAIATGATTPWPGADFTLDLFLADSVYLWACGERSEGEGNAAVSRSEALAGWFVLFTQAVAYIGLWWVSRPQSESEPDGVFDMFAVSGAMYLLLSIAAPDLWACFALIFEGRGGPGEEFLWLTRRRLFGFALLATFLTLVGASIRVLFYESSENLDFVLGAATVLFVADVDEKALTVLKNVSGEWCLFWVLEVVGLSVALAVFAIKITGNGDALNEDDALDNLCAFSSCGVFLWDFVLHIHPTAATVVALLVSSALSRPKSSLASRVLRPPSLKWGAFSSCMGLWTAWGAWASVRRTDSESVYSIPPLAGCVICLTFAFALFYRRELKLGYTNGSRKFRTLDQRPRRCLLWGGVFLILVTFVVKVSTDGYNVPVDVLDALSSLQNLAIDAWLIVGMGLAGLGAASHLLQAPLDPNISVVTLIRSMLLGWGFSETFSAITFLVFDAFGPTDLAEASYDLVELAWKILVGTCVWGERERAFGVAFWTAASLIRNVVLGSVATWILDWVFFFW